MSEQDLKAALLEGTLLESVVGALTEEQVDGLVTRIQAQLNSRWSADHCLYEVEDVHGAVLLADLRGIGPTIRLNPPVDSTGYGQLYDNVHRLDHAGRLRFAKGMFKLHDPAGDDEGVFRGSKEVVWVDVTDENLPAILAAAV